MSASSAALRFCLSYAAIRTGQGAEDADVTEQFCKPVALSDSGSGPHLSFCRGRIAQATPGFEQPPEFFVQVYQILKIWKI